MRPLMLMTSAVLLAGLATLAANSGPGEGLVPPEPSDAEMLKTIDEAKPTNWLGLRAEIEPTKKVYFTGRPVVVELRLRNQTDEPIRVNVPYEKSGGPGSTAAGHPVGGLPLDHVFTRPGPTGDQASRRALLIHKANDPITEYDPDVLFKPAAPVAPIVLRPHGLVGRRLDLARYYPTLRKAGRFYVQWRPYQDALRSPMQEIRIMDEQQAVIETSMGEIRVEFFYDRAPDHVENFVDLARRGFYDQTLFHRVIEGFMIQGGDPFTRESGQQDQWGTGRGPRTLDQEFNTTPFEPGVLGMARGPDVNSASCQFFIVTGPNAGHLTGQYTAFGRVSDQQSAIVAVNIAKVRTDPANNRPREPIVIRRIRIEDVNREEPTTQPD